MREAEAEAGGGRRAFFRGKEAEAGGEISIGKRREAEAEAKFISKRRREAEAKNSRIPPLLDKIQRFQKVTHKKIRGAFGADRVLWNM